MKLSSKLYLLLLFLIAAGVIAYFAYPIIKERYFQENGTTDIGNESPKEIPAGTDVNGTAQEENSAETEDGGDTVPEEQTTLYREITRDDCLNQCADFTGQDLKNYCLQSCGIVPLQDQPVEIENVDCSEKTGLEKDYCIKDLGIDKKDFGICERITDRNIRKACITRIMEDLLENSTLK